MFTLLESNSIHTHIQIHTHPKRKHTMFASCLQSVFLENHPPFLISPYFIKKENSLIFKSYYFSLCLYFSLIFYPKLYIYITLHHSHLILIPEYDSLYSLLYIVFFILTIFIVPWCSIRTSQKECAMQSHGLFDSPSIR